MAQQIVQSNCPGCRTVLRIPIDWLGQSMKCKHCGLTFEVKAKIPPAAPPAPPQQRPMPAPAAPPVAAASGWASADAPAWAQQAATAWAPPAAPVAAPVATAAPVWAPPAAAPVQPAVEAFDTSSTEPLVNVAGYNGRGGRRRRRSSSVVPKIIFSFFLLLALGGAAFGIYYAYSTGLFGATPTNTEQVKKNPTPTDPGRELFEGKGPFPRRMMAISVNNYLYANPVNYGQKIPGMDRSTDGLVSKLAKYMNIDDSQVAVLSDTPLPDKTGTPRPSIPPLKGVIEKAIQEFLQTSRPQDRIVLLFSGHGVEVEEKPYLVPLEGELTKAETLIPLEWVLKQLEECKARQKVLMMDACRYDPGHGLERPMGGPMGEKFDEALKNPPPGVQVLSFCTAGQYSYEFENGVVYGGVVLNKLAELTLQAKGIQRHEDSIPVEKMAEALGKLTLKELQAFYPKGVQTVRLTGTENAEGTSFDPNEPRPEKFRPQGPPTPPGGVAGVAELASILNQVEIPATKIPKEGTAPANLRPESLPPIPRRLLDPYRATDATTDLPKVIAEAVKVMQDNAKAFPDEYRVPTGMNGENQLKTQILEAQKPMGLAQVALEEALDSMKAAAEMREKEVSKRWQANYDYVMARLQARIAYVMEYNYIMGSMRKELPPRESFHDGWRLASQEKMQSGAETRKLVTAAKKLLDKIGEEHAGTPWSILAKRDAMTTLGLQWEAVKFGG